MRSTNFARRAIRAAFASLITLTAVLFAVISFVLTANAAPTTVQTGNGGTGTSTTPKYGQLLIGGASGEYELTSTSSIIGAGTVTSVFGRTGAVTAQNGDYTTSLVPEGSNLYWTQPRFDTALTATTTLPKITTLSGLLLPYAQLTSIPSLFATSSEDYWLTQRQGAAFSTTSANWWGSQQGYITGIAWGAITGTLSNQADLNGRFAATLGTSSPLTANQLVYATGFNTTASVATSTLTASSPLTGTFIQIGSGGSLGCQTASGSQAGCLSSSDWTTFNGKLNLTNLFSQDTNYGALALSTTTAFWFKNGLQASSTSNFVNASTSALSITNGNFDINGSLGELYWSSNKFIYASSTNFATVAGIGAGTGLDATSTVPRDTVFGYQALNTTPAATPIPGDNSAFGYQALKLVSTGIQDTAFGSLAGAATAINNQDAFFGYRAGQTCTGDRLTIIGAISGASGTCGNDVVIVGEAAFTNHSGNNTGVGNGVLAGNGGGSTNAVFGNGSYGADTGGNRNVGVGANTGAGVTNGNNNIVMGTNAASTTALGSGNIALCYDCLFPNGTGANQLNIGNLIFGTGVGTGEGSTVSTGVIGISTTTPFWALTVASSTGPQLALSDSNATDTPWTFRSIANSLYIATSTAIATSSSAALTINGVTGALTLSQPLPIASGGTATTSAVTNGVYYYNGTNAEADNTLTWNGNTLTASPSGNLNATISARGTASTLFFAGYGGTIGSGFFGYNSGALRPLTVGNQGTGGIQILLSAIDSGGTGPTTVGINATSTPWGLLSIAGSAGGTTPLVSVSTSTSAFATTTVFQIDNNGNGYFGSAVSISSSTPTFPQRAGLLTIGGNNNSNSGSSTVSVSKIQIDGYNTAGSRVCVFVVGTSLTVGSGACTQ